jgi:lambda family phage portal protein
MRILDFIGRKINKMMLELGKRYYDAAATNLHNEEHWKKADGRDADSIISPELPTLRNRVRYEVANNCYLTGISRTMADDLVGTGPTLQLQTEEDEQDRITEDSFNEIESRFDEWGQICGADGQSLTDILQLTGVFQQCESGDSVVIMQTRKGATWRKKEVSLRLNVAEPDRLATPMEFWGDSSKVQDGIEFDEFGRPVNYYILKVHPGATLGFNSLAGFGEYDKVPAAAVIHLFVKRRPGQSRGVPWFAPALPLCAYLRRFTLATVAAAETAANPSGTIETGPSGDTTTIPEEFDEIEIPRNSFLTLPNGGKMSQVKPEHPAATYESFKGEIINEIARCVCMPFNVAAGNSSKYNYASGRLDWQGYARFIITYRRKIETKMLDPVFFAWLREALLVPGYLSDAARRAATSKKLVPYWGWPGFLHVDPVKEGLAQDYRLGNLTTNLAIEYAMQGRDWLKELKQTAREQRKIKELGILVEKTITPISLTE